jgi:NADH dehydrogenase FAD-containing subunit
MKELVLLGAGDAHKELLTRMAAKPLTGVRVSLVAPYPHQLGVGSLAGFVAGHHALEDCLVPLEPLLKRASARWLGRRVVALRVEERTLQLDGGGTFGFDWLSINTGGLQDRQQIENLLPGAREHGLFVHPLEAFCALWPRVAELGATRPLRIAILGATRTGLELAMAIRQRLPGSSVTLVTPGAKVAVSEPASVEAKILHALKLRNVTVLSDSAVGLQSEQVLLASGARLACDVPVIAFAVHAPVWLNGSGLALDEQGSVALDAWQRSVSHRHVFAAVGVDSRANQALCRNLRAVLEGLPARHAGPKVNKFKFLSFGDGRALVSWGGFSAQGRWVAWLNDWLDQRHIRRYCRD